MSDDRHGERTFQGIGVSPGIAIGQAILFVAEPVAPTAATHIAPDGIGAEQAALHRAFEQARADLEALARQVARTIDQQAAGIFTAQSLMLADPTIWERAETLIARELLDARSAIRQAGEEQALTLAALADPTLSARAADVRDAVARVIEALHKGDQSRSLVHLLAQASAPPIIVSHDLAPSETARLRPGQVAGICLALGGPTAHAAILARSLAIPAVAGVGEDLLNAVAAGDLIGLDGGNGQVFVRPAAPTAERLRSAMDVTHQRDAAARSRARELATRPASTADGWRVIIGANIGSLAEALAARAWGAEQIGLLRTEFLFGDRATLPSEDEQAEIYVQIFAAFAASARPESVIVARTLDAGADKPLAALRDLMEPEANPALGFRGLRIHLRHPDLLHTQVCALLRAAGATRTPLHLMFPMVATLDEIEQARAIVVSAQAALRASQQPLPADPAIGIMVETPAAAVTADILAPAGAFFSIGTNDLTQYMMAADRLNARVAPLAQPTQPAVLRMIARIAQAGQIAGRLVAVCGEMAGDPTLAALLVGLGVTELSMAAPRIPAVRETLGSASYPALRAWADRVLSLHTLAEVQDLLAAGPPRTGA